MDCRERRIPCTGWVSHAGYIANKDSKGEVRGRSRHKNNSKRVVINLEEINVGAIRRKNPKQGLTSGKDLTIELSEERESPTIG